MFNRLKIIRAKFRLFNDMCPLCNSDAPEFHNCGICNGYHIAMGDKWPPSKSLKKIWLDRYVSVLKANSDIEKIIDQHRVNKKQRHKDL